MSFSIQWAQISSHIQGCLFNPILIFISWHAILHKLQEPTYRNKRLIPEQYRPTHLFFTSRLDWADMAAQKFPWKIKIHFDCVSSRGSYFHLGIWIKNMTCEYYSLKAQFGKQGSDIFFYGNTKSLEENWLHKNALIKKEKRVRSYFGPIQGIHSLLPFIQQYLRGPSSLAA